MFRAKPEAEKAEEEKQARSKNCRYGAHIRSEMGLSMLLD
jgi:hypothetical protein